MLKTLVLAVMAAAATAKPATATSFWYSSMDHTGSPRGYAPNVDNATEYDVFVAVQPGDGGSLQDAITSAPGGQRHKQWLASQPRVRCAARNAPQKLELTLNSGCLYPSGDLRNQRDFIHADGHNSHGRCDQRKRDFQFCLLFVLTGTLASNDQSQQELQRQYFDQW